MDIFGRKKRPNKILELTSPGLFTECAKALQATCNFTTLKPFTYRNITL